MSTSFPTGRYGVILADPPRSFQTWSSRGRDRCPDTRHYSVMTLADIKALPVANIAARDSALFLWVIDTHLEQALELGRVWGFEYKTVGFVWAKTTQTGGWAFSLGYWTRKGAEVCLMFTRGKPQRLSASVRQLIVAARREHSRKPDEAYGAIEALLPGPYLEMFARHRRPGWDAWGDEAPAA